MLHEMELSKSLWAEVANTAVFLQNRLPTKALEEKTPFEAWYGYKPPLNFLKVFGCVRFVHLPQAKRDKLDKKAIPGIFVGYSLVYKAYKVYHPQTEKMTINRDVHFNGEEKWDWKNPQSTSPRDILSSLPEHQAIKQWLNEIEDDPPVRGYRPLSDIYERCNVAICEPTNHEETLKDPKWKKAMEEEMLMIRKNKTWELVSTPEDRKIISVKWVFRTKLNADGSINKHKIRHNQIGASNCNSKRLESVPIKCQISVFKWRIKGGNLCATTRGLCETRRRTQSLLIQKGFVWPKASSKGMVHQN